jgi:hypothetical protein
MKDVTVENWEAMAEFSNAITMLVDSTVLTPPEVRAALEMILAHLIRLLEVKKAVR